MELAIIKAIDNAAKAQAAVTAELLEEQRRTNALLTRLVEAQSKVPV